MEDLVEHVVALEGRDLRLLAPRDSDALLDEEAFEHEEFLPYWAELWPSAVALARVVARRPLTGRRVLELGCGLGLPAIAAALGGGRVLATDWSAEAVAMTAGNAARNDAPLETAVFRWDDPPEALGPPWTLVLASDVLYEPRNVDLLLALLPRVTAAAGEVWLSDPGRAPATRFLEAAAKTWRLDTVPHDGPAHVTVHRLRGKYDPATALDTRRAAPRARDRAEGVPPLADYDPATALDTRRAAPRARDRAEGVPPLAVTTARPAP
jgi:predicted nicotinamide N-methyase